MLVGILIFQAPIPDKSQNTLPPTLNLMNPGDPQEEFNCNYVTRSAQQKDVRVAMSNSFGFGGTNASLCFTKM